MEGVNAESQNVLKYLIKSSPYGETQEVLKDLQRLMPVNTNDEFFSQNLKSHSEDHLAVFTEAKYNYLALPEAARQDYYIHQARQEIFRVNHRQQKVVGVDKVDAASLGLSAQTEEFVRVFQERLENYAEKYYRDPWGALVFADVSQNEESGQPVIHFGYTGKNLNLPNFYGGEWIGKWKLHGDKLTGSISINSHFFESGNVQLHQNKALETTVTGGLGKGTIDAVLKFIEKAEGDLQAHLNKLYDEQLPTKFFKALRRVQPVTQTKMNWNVQLIDMKKNLMTAGQPR